MLAQPLSAKFGNRLYRCGSWSTGVAEDPMMSLHVSEETCRHENDEAGLIVRKLNRATSVNAGT